MSRSVVKKCAPVAPELTPWFDGSVKPARPGVYERRLDGVCGHSYWDGKTWWCNTLYGVRRAFSLRNVVVSAHRSLPWRGLAKKPEAA